MAKTDRTDLEARIRVEPSIRLLSIRQAAGQLPSLLQQQSLGPYAWNSDDLGLEINGTLVASGRLEIGPEGGRFIISEINQGGNE